MESLPKHEFVAEQIASDIYDRPSIETRAAFVAALSEELRAIHDGYEWERRNILAALTALATCPVVAGLSAHIRAEAEKAGRADELATALAAIASAVLVAPSDPESVTPEGK